MALPAPSVPSRLDDQKRDDYDGDKNATGNHGDGRGDTYQRIAKQEEEQETRRITANTRALPTASVVTL